MLKNRLIPVLFLKDGYLVRSESFSAYQILGNPVAQVQRYNDWDVDELIYIDISASYNSRNSLTVSPHGDASPIAFLDIISAVSKNCLMPLTFGGGITSLSEASARFQLGADKITINSQSLRSPKFISELAYEFGSQAIVVSIDCIKIDNIYHIFDHLTAAAYPIDLYEWLSQIQDLGAGEILLNSVDRDGKATGYDLTLLKSVVDVTSVPVIACGGVGHYSDFSDAITQSGVMAVAAGNIFNFKELAYPMAKRFLKKSGLNFR